jgi:hypothetical protein
VLATSEGHLVSGFPLVTPLLATPLYVPAALWLHHRGFEPRRVEMIGERMEKLAAAAITAAAVSLMHLLLRRRLPVWRAAMLTLAFAFGTGCWPLASQALWQHGPALVLLLGALLAVTSEADSRRVATAGFLVGTLVANRPPDVILSLSLLAFAWPWASKKRVLLVVATAVPILSVAWLNMSVYETPLGGYPLIGSTDQGAFANPWLKGLAALLASPGKGLFAHSPFLVLVMGRLLFRVGDRWSSLLDPALAVGFLAQLLLYSTRSDWHGGSCYGPRFLLDAVPLLVWLMAPTVARLRRPGLVAFALLVFLSQAAQAVGAFCYQGASDTRDLWSIRDHPAWVDARGGVLPPRFLQTFTPVRDVTMPVARVRRISHGAWVGVTEIELGPAPRWGAR